MNSLCMARCHMDFDHYFLPSRERQHRFWHQLGRARQEPEAFGLLDVPRQRIPSSFIRLKRA